MSRLWIIVRREMVEGLRQRWLVVTLATVLVIITVGSLGLLWVIDMIVENPKMQEKLTFWSEVYGMTVSDPATQLAGTVVPFLEALVFNQLMSMTAVMAGHAALHDRQTGTLPFLLLAPIRRFELLVGKVLGALSVPLLVYVAIGGAASVAATSFASATPNAAYLPPSGGWVAMFLVGAPVWSVFTGTICVLVSSVARDVRTAQQASWAVVFFATFVLSPILVGLMPYGPGAGLELSAVGLVLSAVALGVGARLIGRDLTR